MVSDLLGFSLKADSLLLDSFLPEVSRLARSAPGPGRGTHGAAINPYLVVIRTFDN
jgi:hypothetical protein